jgi:5'-nucleotidase/UDP-sugar diphosphatase
LTKTYWRWTVGTLACLALICSLVVILPVVQTAEAQETKVFTILHTNDEHSELIPHGPASDYPNYPTTGGFSRIANEIGRIKAEKAAAGEPVLTLSAGDYNQGTPFGWLETQAAAELVLMQMMGYDAIAIGNHDFDMGVGYRYMAWLFAKFLAPAAGGPINIPILNANISFDVTDPDAANLKTLYSVVDKQGTELAIQPYTVKTLSNGLKVGIFGLLGVEAEAVAPAAALGGVTFGNVYDDEGELDQNMSFFSRAVAAQQMVNVLTSEDIGCDVVVCLSHSGTDEEVQLAQFVPGIDVIVGGHSHDLNYPPIMVGDTIVVQAGSYTRYLGELELEYAGGKVSVRNANAIKMDDSIPTVPAIDAVIGNYVAGLNAQLAALLGGKSMLDRTMETDLGGDGGFNLNVNPPMVETNLGDLVTDAYRSITSALSTDGNPTQIAFEANGLIRGAIPKGGLGQFCFYDLVSAIPLGASSTDISSMGYSLVSFYLLGAELQGVLEGTLDMGMNDFFVQLSGARYSSRPAAPLGSKVTSFEVDDGAGGWEPINPGALYKVATNYYAASFLAAFNVIPRTQAGAQDPNLNHFLVYYAPGQEMRGWLALYQYIMGVGDLDGDGLANVPPIYADYTQMRINQAGWYLAEGTTLFGMETFVLIQNPSAADVHVNVKFQTDTGEEAPDMLQGVAIPANSRVTFKVNDFVKDDWEISTGLSTVVEPIDGDVIVERAMYGNDRTWAHDSIGVTTPSPAPEWYLAEGSTGGGMETWLLVQNPYDSAAHVNIVFQTDAGPVAPADLQGVTLLPNSRATFNLAQWVPDNYNVSTYVEAEDGLIVCERAMYGGNRTWAHDSIGTPVLGFDWYLAEGSTDGGMETFVLVQNPTDADVHVDIAFQTDAGEVAPPDLQGVTIPAQSRRTFKVNDWVTNYNVSTYVVATDGAVVCERAMYGDNRTWAHDTVGSPVFDNQWYLAEGSTDGGMETFVLVQNPDDTDAQVNITFQTDTGKVAPPNLQGVIIPANSRRTFKVNDYVTTFNVSTMVEATTGWVVCERAMYGNNRTWAHDSIGYAPW